MKGLGEVTVISVAPNAVYHATGKRVRGLPITVEKIVLKGAMAGRRAVAVFRGLSLGIGSGIHPAINGEIRAGNVRGLRTGDKRHNLPSNVHQTKHSRVSFLEAHSCTQRTCGGRF